MMFYLHRLSEQFSGFNVFYYVTFRAVAAAVTAFALSLAFGNFVIRKLISLKIGQPIRTASRKCAVWPNCTAANRARPRWAACSSSARSIIASVFWARPDNRVRLARPLQHGLSRRARISSMTTSRSRRKSDGISGRLKLVFQLLLAGIVTGVFLTQSADRSPGALALSAVLQSARDRQHGRASRFFFFALVIVGSSNAVNLTDGLDGLAIGCTDHGRFRLRLLLLTPPEIFASREYLQVPFYPFTGELTVGLRRARRRRPRLSLVQLSSRPKFSWATPARSRSAG